jgi:hypothetical protein
MKATIIALAYVIATPAQPADAASFTVKAYGRPFYRDGVPMMPGCVTLSGPIEPGDRQRLRAFMAEQRQARWDLNCIDLNSPGGDVAAAVLIAAFVNGRPEDQSDQLLTTIHAGDTCASACALIFFAGGPQRIEGALVWACTTHRRLTVTKRRTPSTRRRSRLPGCGNTASNLRLSVSCWQRRPTGSHG